MTKRGGLFFGFRWWSRPSSKVLAGMMAGMSQTCMRSLFGLPDLRAEKSNSRSRPSSAPRIRRSEGPFRNSVIECNQEQRGFRGAGLWLLLRQRRDVAQNVSGRLDAECAEVDHFHPRMCVEDLVQNLIRH